MVCTSCCSIRSCLIRAEVSPVVYWLFARAQDGASETGRRRVRGTGRCRTEPALRRKGHGTADAGEAAGDWKHGRYAKEALAERRCVHGPLRHGADLIRELQATMHAR